MQRRKVKVISSVLLGYVGLALVYLWATPPFEASDELWHFGMIQHIAETGTLPVQVVGVETPWEQEGSQPPLYYLIAAALVGGVDRSDFEAVRQPNPHAQAGVPSAVGNKNLVLHDSPHPAWQGTVLAVYLARLLSIALGVVAVSAVYGSARTLKPDKPGVALLAAGLTAFNPMFLFITASVNNDNLVTALNSVVIWQTLVMLRDGFSTRRSLVIALLIALASLSKLSGLVLIPVVGLAAVWTAYRSRNWRGMLALVTLMAAAWVVIAGGWYGRNVTLYGELFGTATMAQVAGVREEAEAFTPMTLFREFEGFRAAYWGWFGAVNILTFPAFYVVMDAVTLAGIGGVIVYWLRAKHASPLQKGNDNTERGSASPLQVHQTGQILILMLTVVIGAAGVIAWTAQTYASQGRLLFPYVAATSPLLALGFVTLWERAHVLIAPLAIFALVVPFTHIAPAYTPPARLDQLPDGATQVYARFDDLELIGYETPRVRYQPGDSVPITLYWRVLAAAERDLSLWLHAVGPDGEVIGKVDSYPGGGLLRTTRWQPGIYADRYTIPLSKDAAGRFPLRAQVGWWHYPTETLVEPTDENGGVLSSVMLDVGGFGAREQEAPLEGAIAPSEAVTFGGVITLKGYTFENDHLSLLWEATGDLPDGENYTVFVQVLDDENQIKGQGDAPPELPTSFWERGEQFITNHPITYSQPSDEGEYRVVIGWYRPDDFSRLDTNHPDNAYPLVRFEIRGTTSSAIMPVISRLGRPRMSSMK